MEFIILITWLALCFLVAKIGYKRNIGWGWALFLSLLLSPLIGIIVVALSGKKTEASHKYKEHYEIAKREEYKGNTVLAIDEYKNALYHLENDYNNLSSKGEVARQNRINEVKGRLAGLE